MKKIPHQLTPNVKILQKAVLVCNGKFLILQRSPDSKTRPAKWDLPGGNSEWPEVNHNTRSLHRADIIREIIEETGIVVSDKDLGEQVYFDTYFEAEKQLYSIITGWKVNLPTQPEVEISDEHTGFAWITPEQFDQYDFGFAGESEGFIRKMVEGSFEDYCPNTTQGT